MTTFSSAARPRVVLGRGIKSSLSGREGNRGEAGGLDANFAFESQPAVEQTLSELLDRARSQVLLLRRALDEAATLERGSITRAADLTQRLELGKRMGAEFDQRLEAAHKAAGVLPQAASALRGLEALVEQMRAMQSGAEQRFAAQVAEAQARVERSLMDELEKTRSQMRVRCEEFAGAFRGELDGASERLRGVVDEYEQRLRDQEERFETRLRDMSARIAESEGNVENAHQRLADHIAGAWGGIEKRLLVESDRLSSEIDRKSAGVQARLSLILDSAAERVDILDSQGSRLSGDIEGRVQSMCDRAARLLGLSTLSASGEPVVEGDEPRQGSLLAALDEARVVLSTADGAATRLSLLVQRADEATQRARETLENAQVVAATREGEAERVERTIQQGLEQLKMFEQSLGSAAERHQAGLEELQRVREMTSTAREDLQAMAAAASFHAEQVREQEARLDEARRRAEASAAEATSRAAALDRAMEQVTNQAAELVAMARDVSVLVDKARQSRDGQAGESEDDGDAMASAAA